MIKVDKLFVCISISKNPTGSKQRNDNNFTNSFISGSKLLELCQISCQLIVKSAKSFAPDILNTTLKFVVSSWISLLHSTETFYVLMAFNDGISRRFLSL